MHKWWMKNTFQEHYDVFFKLASLGKMSKSEKILSLKLGENSVGKNFFKRENYTIVFFS